MIWLELRTKNTKYKKGWNLYESIWAPFKKENGSIWPFWSSIRRIESGDVIFHISKIKTDNFFTGYSIAKHKYYKTYENPFLNDTNSFIEKSKVELIDFFELQPKVKVKDFFISNDEILRKYYEANKLRTKKELLFYTIQKNKLQCLTGAYISEFPEPFAKLLTPDLQINTIIPQVSNNVITSSTKREIETRIGQNIFSKNVKANYEFKCCYPNCEISGSEFLIGGHIARWADEEIYRGQIGNGLCFCLLHDKAFEKGYFTLNKLFNIVILYNNIDPDNKWLLNYLEVGKGLEIKNRNIDPIQETLMKHWQRVNATFLAE